MNGPGRQPNQMGRDAMKHAREFCPKRFAQLSDPDGYFFDLGEQMSERIDQLEEQMAGNAPAGQTWIDKVGWLNMAGLMAREAVYSEMLYQEWPAEASAEEEDPDDEPWINLNPPLIPEEGGPEHPQIPQEARSPKGRCDYPREIGPFRAERTDGS